MKSENAQNHGDISNGFTRPFQLLI